MTVKSSVNLIAVANNLYEEGFIDFGVISALVEKLQEVTGPLQNEIIHLQTQLRQSEKALDIVKNSSYNEGVEDSARLIENNPGWFERLQDDAQQFAEEIRNLKQQ